MPIPKAQQEQLDIFLKKSKYLKKQCKYLELWGELNAIEGIFNTFIL